MKKLTIVIPNRSIPIDQNNNKNCLKKKNEKDKKEKKRKN